jgi:peptide/nickel transport system permease protein
MTRFVLRRLLLVVPSLFGLLVLTFVMLRVLPNDPSAALAGENATPAQIAAIRKAYGFDEPIWKQFLIYLRQVAQADLGNSTNTGRPVSSDIARRLPATIELTFFALLFATLVGVPLGTLAAVWHNSAFDHIMRIVTVGGLAIAAFWFAIILQLVFAMDLEWLPLRGRLAVGTPEPARITGLFLVDSLLTSCRPSPSPSAASPPLPASRARASSTHCRRTSSATPRRPATGAAASSGSMCCATPWSPPPPRSACCSAP